MPAAHNCHILMLIMSSSTHTHTVCVRCSAAFAPPHWIAFALDLCYFDWNSGHINSAKCKRCHSIGSMGYLFKCHGMKQMCIWKSMDIIQSVCVCVSVARAALLNDKWPDSHIFIFKRIRKGTRANRSLLLAIRNDGFSCASQMFDISCVWILQSLKNRKSAFHGYFRMLN